MEAISVDSVWTSIQMLPYNDLTILCQRINNIFLKNKLEGSHHTHSRHIISDEELEADVKDCASLDDALFDHLSKEDMHNLDKSGTYKTIKGIEKWLNISRGL